MNRSLMTIMVSRAVQLFPRNLRAASLLAASLTITPLASVNGIAGPLFYYDIAGATSSTLPLAPIYQSNSNASLTATAFIESGLSPTWACCQNGAGELSFTGWGDGRPGPAFNPGTQGSYLGFSVTANNGPVSLSTLDYSWFSDLNSFLYNGPDRLSIYVSFDGFNSANLIGTHYTPPGYPYFGSVNNFSDDLSAFTILQGQTMSVRFVAWADAAFWDSGAGPWNILSGGENITLSGATQGTPEPASWTICIAGIALIVLVSRRDRKLVCPAPILP